MTIMPPAQIRMETTTVPVIVDTVAMELRVRILTSVPPEPIIAATTPFVQIRMEILNVHVIPVLMILLVMAPNVMVSSFHFFYTESILISKSISLPSQSKTNCQKRGLEKVSFFCEVKIFPSHFFTHNRCSPCLQIKSIQEYLF